MSKIVLMTANITGASGGFGMYQMGEACVYPIGYRAEDPDAQWDDINDAVSSYLDEARGSGLEIEQTDEIDGRIYDQNGAIVYRAGEGDDAHYFALWAMNPPAPSDAVD